MTANEITKLALKELDKMKTVRKNKYGNIKTVVDGIRFDSKKEAKRYGHLKLLERAGEILHIEVHPKYRLLVKGEEIGRYEADFSYWDKKNQSMIIEDCKGVKTAVYRLKKKLMKAIYGIEILET